MPPAGPVAFGFECPGDGNQDDQQRREHPQQGAGDGGHGSLVVVTNRGRSGPRRLDENDLLPDY